MSDKKSKKKSLHIIVVVLGDLGRSPRMQYHANSLLKQGHYVSFVGYNGEVRSNNRDCHFIPKINHFVKFTYNCDAFVRLKDLIPELQNNRGGRLSVVRFSVPAPEALRKFLPVYLVWRVLSLFLCLFHALLISVPRGFCEKKRVDGVLVQNPPAMPLLAVVYLYCNIIKAVNGYRPAFIIDWHNLVRKGFRKAFAMLRLL